MAHLRLAQRHVLQHGETIGEEPIQSLQPRVIMTGQRQLTLRCLHVLNKFRQAQEPISLPLLIANMQWQWDYKF